MRLMALSWQIFRCFFCPTMQSAIYNHATCYFHALLPVAGAELLIKLAVLYWAISTFDYLAPIIGLIVAILAGAYWLYGTMALKRLR